MSKFNLCVIAKILDDQELGYDRDDAIKDITPPGHLPTFSEAINTVLCHKCTSVKSCNYAKVAQMAVRFGSGLY